MLAAATLLRTVLPGMRATFGVDRHGDILLGKGALQRDDIVEYFSTALVGLAATLANEVAGDEIAVNNVMPGCARTSRIVQLSELISKLDSRPPEAIVAEWEREISMRRFFSQSMAV